MADIEIDICVSTRQTSNHTVGIAQDLVSLRSLASVCVCVKHYPTRKQEKIEMSLVMQELLSETFFGENGKTATVTVRKYNIAET